MSHHTTTVSAAVVSGLAAQIESREQALTDTCAIVAELSNERDALESLIADRCADLFDVEPSDLSLPDMVEALIEAYQAERVRAGVRAMVPESPAPASYIVLVDGHRIGPMFDTEQAARAQVEELVHANPTYRFALVCRVIDEAKVRHVLQWTFAEEGIL